MNWPSSIQVFSHLTTHFIHMEPSCQYPTLYSSVRLRHEAEGRWCKCPVASYLPEWSVCWCRFVLFIFWDAALCIRIEVRWRYGGTCCFHRHGRGVCWTFKQQTNFAWSLLGLLLNSEDGGGTLHRNVGQLLPIAQRHVPGWSTRPSLHREISHISKYWPM